MTIHSGILAQGQRSLVGYSTWGCKEFRHDWSNLGAAGNQLLRDLVYRLRVSSATKEEEICPKGKKGAACL